MKSIYRIGSLILVLLVLAVRPAFCADRMVASVKSPDGRLVFELLSDENNALFYQLSKESEQLVARSALGINTSIGDFSTGLTAGEAKTEVVDETYVLPSGKKSTYIDKCNELRVPFSLGGNTLFVVVRVYDDGAAYRYELNGTGPLTVFGELSECRVAGKGRIYSQVYSRDYKNLMEESDWDRESCLQHTSLPLLVQSGEKKYVLLSEAGVDGCYAASKLYTNDDSEAFVFDFIGKVETTLPFRSPWRMMMTGSLADIVESTLPDNLNKPTEMTELSWIKPGRAAWSYGGEDTSGYLSMKNVEEYIDWASEMGWEYFTLDRGWEDNSNAISLSKAVSYAKGKNVDLLVWVNQTKLPTDSISLNNRMLNWKNQGVKGVKVDFWEDDSQTMMKRYDLLFRIAANQKMLVNLHSCTKPTGLRRTWPHLLTSEAVTTNAYYAESPNVVTAVHNINAAIVRGSLGAVDYAPTNFADKQGKIHYGTTWAHQMALSVVFESGLQHINESPDILRYHVSKEFLKNLPAAWDDTKCLDAELNSRFTIARQKGDDWYVATLTDSARLSEIKLDFLVSGNMYNAYIYRDGSCPSDLHFEYKQGLTSSDKLSLSLLEHGGAVLVLSPSGAYGKPEIIKYEAESPDNRIPFGVGVRTDVDSLCSGGEYVASIGNGRPLTFQKIIVPQSGTYALTLYYTAAELRQAYVEVNGRSDTRREYTFLGTGSDTGNGLAMKTVLVQLDAAAENSIEFGSAGGYAPALDRIELSFVGAGGTGVDNPESDKQIGAVYVEDRNIILKQNSDTQYLLFNSIGQLIESGTFRGGMHSIPVAEAGVYLIKLEAEGAGFTHKVIVK